MLEGGHTSGMSRNERLGLWALGLFVAVSLLGYGTFGRHPEWLSSQPSWAAGFYAASFGLFAQGQVWLAGAVLLVFLSKRVGGVWVPAFAVLYGASLFSELMGTTYGVPFGAYRYGEALGVQWLGRVPLVIPLSWFCMAVASFGVSRLVVGGRNRWLRAAVASLVLLSWDLSLDPAMSWVTKYWFWSESGPYYGMPWLNLAGWYVTGLVLMAALVWLRADRWIDALPVSWLAGYWLVNLALPLGMNALAGLGVAVVVAMATLVVFGVLASVRSRRGTVRALMWAVEARGGAA